MKKNLVYVIAGPTAVGKGTVVKRLLSLYPQLAVSVSMTTRPPRPGEKDGEDYRFVSRSDFENLIEGGQFLEWAQVHGNHYYGTPRQWVEEQQAQGSVVVLEIDLAGARQVRESMPEANFIFLAPPSWEELVSRLTGRGTESAEEQERRLITAREELASAGEFDVVVTNDNLEETVAELAGLMGIA